MTTANPEMMTVSVAFIDNLLNVTKQETTRLVNAACHDQYRLSESSYGATQSAVIVLRAKGFQQLRSMIRERRFYRGGDNPGQIYAADCKPVYIHRGDHGEIEAVCIASNHRDI